MRILLCQYRFTEVKFSAVVLGKRSTTGQIGGRESARISWNLGGAEKILQSYFGAEICELAGKCTTIGALNQVKYIIINHITKEVGLEVEIEVLRRKSAS